VSGNVSLYNETDGRPILPTPTVAVVGQLRALDDHVTQWFKGAGDVVLLLGAPPDRGRGAPGLGGSEYAARRGHGTYGAPPRIDLALEAKLQRLVLDLAREHLLRSAHDVSEGGLAVALAECCVTAPLAGSDVGARVDLEAPAGGPASLEAASLLFGEHPSRVVVSVARAALDRVVAEAAKADVACTELGVTGGSTLSLVLADTRAPVSATPRAPTLVVATGDLRTARETCLSSIVGD
jgi:phosphoribosylformylglycinamidine synthase